MNARVFVVLLLSSAQALAADFSVGSPLKDERKIISGRVGATPGDVSARGLFVSGTRGGVAYSQGGGEVIVRGGLHFFQTSFGGILGAEADFSIGGASSEQSSDGTMRDQRREGGTAAERAKSLVWVTSRLGVRVSLSLPILQLGSSTAFRLGMLGGALLEANGSRSFEFSPAFTAGAQLGFVLGPLSGLASYLAVPTQGIEQTLTRHTFSLELGVGPILLGASVQLDAVTLEAVRGVAQGPLESRTIGVHAGYRFPPFEVR
ncbi:MAG: hypothetical protein GQE15_20055 [Archangiaceae bacterium]|nr:hypothetical protein [Archangiaceae bacterium]